MSVFTLVAVAASAAVVGRLPLPPVTSLTCMDNGPGGILAVLPAVQPSTASLPIFIIMTKYRIIIHLHHATEHDESALLHALERQSFTWLRDNEYGYEGRIALAELNRVVSDTVSKIVKGYAFTVMKEKVLR
jgi:hypothetical protein